MSVFDPPQPPRLGICPVPHPDAEVLCAQGCGREWYIMRNNKGAWEPTCGICFVRLAKQGTLLEFPLPHPPKVGALLPKAHETLAQRRLRARMGVLA